MEETITTFLCRTCLQEYEEDNSNAEITSIFSICKRNFGEIRVFDMISICLSVRLSDNDQMPLTICMECTNKLYLCYEFKRQIEQSEIRLQELVSSQLNELTKSVTNNINEGELLIHDDDQYNEFKTMNNITVKEDSECDAADNQFLEFLNPHNEQPFYSCEICLSKFGTEHMLELHSKDHITKKKKTTKETNIGAVCQKIIPIKNEEITDHTANYTNVEIDQILMQNECPICQRRYPHESRLNKHIIDKHAIGIGSDVDAKPYQCELCGKSYTTLTNLTLHKISHTGIKPFSCDICNRGFKKKWSLESHMAIHTGIRKYPCSDCGRSFTAATYLQQHRKIHSNFKQYRCTICPVGFHKSKDLKEHIRTHTGEKPFLCSICGRGFSRNTQLNIHYRTHTGEKPYSCPQCNRAFAVTGDLKMHIRIHTGEKPYSCKICNKRFIQSSGLKSHEKLHTGEKNYTCVVCQKTFTQSSSLARHTKMHEGK